MLPIESWFIALSPIIRIRCRLLLQKSFSSKLCSSIVTSESVDAVESGSSRVWVDAQLFETLLDNSEDNSLPKFIFPSSINFGIPNNFLLFSPAHKDDYDDIDSSPAITSFILGSAAVAVAVVEPI